MANYEATRYDFDGANLTDIQGVNTGLIIPWCSTSVPEGFLDCDGSAVSRTTYSALFAIIGTTYGSGDGSTTFNVPDLDDKVVKGKSPSTNLGTAKNTNTITATGNISVSLANHTLSLSELPSHNHGPGGTNNSRQEANPGSKGASAANTGGAGGSGAHGHTANCTFTGGSDDVTQPINVTKYIIKT